MKVWKIFIALVCLSTFIAGYQHAHAQQNLAQEVYAIFQQSCLNCHGASGAFKETLLIDRTALIDTNVVIPGDPENSEFYKRLLGPTENGPQMPLNLPPLSQEAIQTIARWITAGAPDWNVPHDINFITTDAILDTIRNHLKSLDPFDRPSARYFTMTHLYNAGESSETLSDYRIALSKLINSLSWKLEITNPIPIDEAQTIFYIDLRRYKWNTTTDVWAQIEQVYSYNIAFDPETQAGLLEKLTQLQTGTGSTVPFVNVDWFLATASLPPLYHDILGLPETDSVLEAQLGVNVASHITDAPGIDVWRAGFNDSGVSENNRVVERHTSSYGAYWKSYDFAGNVGSQNIFTHPLDFTQDGGEIVFNLPNGLQAYLLVDANGNRLDDAPIEIVSNPAASDPTVKNGLSCIGCHTQGMKTFTDSVRAAIEQDDNPPYNKAQALRLYPEQSVLDALVAKDTLKFQQALEKIGGPFADDASRQQFFKHHENEPIQRFHEAFQAPLDASDAAAAVGLETAAFLTQIREKQSLKNLGLQTLIDVNGTVKRDAWTSNFDDMISALNTPDSTLPPVVQRPELIPGESVHIPDPNLRAAIAEVLGKNNTAIVSITAEEMTTLTTLRAGNRDIKDLTGIEHAVNLENIWISGNPITDLSPLAALKNLIGLAAWDMDIEDFSPLAELTNLKWLELFNTPISDLSPLARLTSLKRMSLYGTRTENLSPLAGLTSLTQLQIANNETLSDISPLAGLINLEWLDLHRCDSLSDLSPLAGLTKLEYLNLNHTRRVSDYSLAPLSGLTGLRRLRLAENRIPDVSPLSGLIDLARLDLPRNEIVDLSPLSGLAGLTELYLNANRISDVSPLAGLINLEWLDLRVNQIPDISSLDGLAARTYISWLKNPGAPIEGPKIEGPWLWVPIPEKQVDNSTDLLSEVSGGSVTEHQIATKGATEGEEVGNYEWAAHKISPIGLDNGIINNMQEIVRTFGLPEEYEWSTEVIVVYGSVILDSPREQKTRMFVGSEGRNKVWLNGELIYEQLIRPTEYDYWWDDSDGCHQYFPVTLKPGANVLLVAVGNGGTMTGHFGFEEGTEYTVMPPGVGFTFSATETNLLAGDTFTLNLNAEKVSDLAGWQADIAYNPNVLEAVEVNEGDFLKAEGGNTFFQDGTIDNTTGKITDLFSARISESGVGGTGILMSVTFKAKAGGETQVTLENFEFSSISGKVIPSVPPNITMTIGEYPAWDVNQDGRVSISDLVLVAKDLGSDAPANLRTDVNRDGTINIQDLILVAQHLGESTAAAAPFAIAINNGELTPAMVQAWITQAQIEDDGSIAFQQGIATLERLLTLFIPEETALLHNYPNPFNPETWIPYQLADPAEVTLTIHSVNGALVRMLALGYQPAGIYQTRTRAAYWDGKNQVGEPVASGIYFYTLTAGNFNATRKMLIRK